MHPQSIVHAWSAFATARCWRSWPAPTCARRSPLSLAWPARMAAPTKRLDLVELGTLTFERPDEARFPALGLAREAMQRGGMAPAVLNAANEVAVEAFLTGRLGFLQIAQLVAETLEMADGARPAGARPTDLSARAGRRCGGARVGAELAGDQWCADRPRALTRARGAELRVDDRSWRLDGDGMLDQGLGGFCRRYPGRSAAVPVRADGRRVRPRARPFPGGALVRRQGQGLLDRLRPGDLRLQRPPRHALALRLDPARRLRQVPGRREQRQRAHRGRPCNA